MSVAHNVEAKLRTEDVHIAEQINFSELLLSDAVLDGLTKAGFKRPSPIQLRAIPMGRCGLDLIVQAKSGTGKTCVFSVIALEGIDVSSDTSQVLVLAPTREIAIQITNVIQTIGSSVPGLMAHAFIGGTPFNQDKVRARHCHIVVGTPGRIKQLIELGILKVNSIRLFVLDEADMLLDRGFTEPINWIYSTLPNNKQILALSATYPEYLATQLTKYMRNPTFVRLNISDPALLGIKQYHHLVPSHHLPNKMFDYKIETVLNILSCVDFQQCLIFSNQQYRAENLQTELQAHDWPTVCIAGCLDQKERNFAMDQLKTYQCRILISTDLTSRGIDADKVNLVINLDVPKDHETYLHRIGRAGRFGSYGAAISIVSEKSEDKELWAVERKCKTQILKLPDPIPKDLAVKKIAVKLSDVVTTEKIVTHLDVSGELSISLAPAHQENASLSHCGECQPQRDLDIPQLTSNPATNGHKSLDHLDPTPEISLSPEKIANSRTSMSVSPSHEHDGSNQQHELGEEESRSKIYGHYVSNGQCGDGSSSTLVYGLTKSDNKEGKFGKKEAPIDSNHENPGKQNCEVVKESKEENVGPDKKQPTGINLKTISDKDTENTNVIDVKNLSHENVEGPNPVTHSDDRQVYTGKALQENFGVKKLNFKSAATHSPFSNSSVLDELNGLLELAHTVSDEIFLPVHSRSQGEGEGSDKTDPNRLHRGKKLGNSFSRKSTKKKQTSHLSAKSTHKQDTVERHNTVPLKVSCKENIEVDKPDILSPMTNIKTNLPSTEEDKRLLSEVSMISKQCPESHVSFIESNHTFERDSILNQTDVLPVMKIATSKTKDSSSMKKPSTDGDLATYPTRHSPCSTKGNKRSLGERENGSSAKDSADQNVNRCKTIPSTQSTYHGYIDGSSRDRLAFSSVKNDVSDRWDMTLAGRTTAVHFKLKTSKYIQSRPCSRPMNSINFTTFPYSLEMHSDIPKAPNVENFESGNELSSCKKDLVQISDGNDGIKQKGTRPSSLNQVELLSKESTTTDTNLCALSSLNALIFPPETQASNQSVSVIQKSFYDCFSQIEQSSSSNEDKIDLITLPIQSLSVESLQKIACICDDEFSFLTELKAKLVECVEMAKQNRGQQQSVVLSSPCNKSDEDRNRALKSDVKKGKAERKILKPSKQVKARREKVKNVDRDLDQTQVMDGHLEAEKNVPGCSEMTSLDLDQNVNEFVEKCNKQILNFVHGNANDERVERVQDESETFVLQELSSMDASEGVLEYHTRCKKNPMKEVKTFHTSQKDIKFRHSSKAETPIISAKSTGHQVKGPWPKVSMQSSTVSSVTDDASEKEYTFKHPVPASHNFTSKSRVKKSARTKGQRKRDDHGRITADSYTVDTDSDSDVSSFSQTDYDQFYQQFEGIHHPSSSSSRRKQRSRHSHDQRPPYDQNELYGSPFVHPGVYVPFTSPYFLPVHGYPHDPYLSNHYPLMASRGYSPYPSYPAQPLNHYSCSPYHCHHHHHQQQQQQHQPWFHMPYHLPPPQAFYSSVHQTARQVQVAPHAYFAGGQEHPFSSKCASHYSKYIKYMTKVLKQLKKEYEMKKNKSSQC